MISNLHNYSIGILIKRRLVALQNWATFKLVLWRHNRYFGSLELSRFGSNYGGWWVPNEVEFTHVSKLLVSVGLGYDVTFDEALLERGWSVLGVDPLAECCDFASKYLNHFESFQLINAGLAVFDGHQKFFQPKDSSHDSWSTINVQMVSNPYFQIFPVVSFETILAIHKGTKDGSYKYLKMDIEGAELAILQDCTNRLIEFNFIAVEMDFLSLIPFREFNLRLQRIQIARRIIRDLEKLGLRLVHVENSNFFWKNQHLL